VARLVAALCALAALACARGAPAPADARAAPAAAEAASAADSLRGTVRVVGSEPLTQVVLEPAGGGAAVALEGERAVLQRLAAIEVMVAGDAETPGRFRVARVAVRSANGVPAVDGVLAREGDRWVLATADGRRLPVPHLPEALRDHAGARVWLAGPLDRAPDSFGVIVEIP